MSDLEHNKRTVVAFFTRAYNDHEPDDAVAKYVGSLGLSHPITDFVSEVDEVLEEARRDNSNSVPI